MGLDITVNKIIKASENEVANEGFFRLMDDEGNYVNEHPKWTKKFEVNYSQEFYDWDRYKQDTGIDVDDYDWDYEEYSEKGHFMGLISKAIKDEILKIDLEKVPTFNKIIKVLPRKIVGYQRKGLNEQFYDDYEDGKIGYFVWTKKELEEYREKYCTNLQEKNDFQKNIIDKFTEGEDCVTFSW